MSLESVNLASARLGAAAAAASDEFFAPAQSLLRERPPVFDPDAYTERGKLMDGWESRRRRDGDRDWCVIALGVPGIVSQILVDTAWFRGNHPDACAIDGCEADGVPGDDAAWMPLAERTPLEGDARHLLPAQAAWRFTHVRLSIFPDGGVARLRALGEPLPDLRALVAGDPAPDLAATKSGGRVLDCSDRFFSSPHNLLAPGPPENMGDGWETRRRRGPGHDWVEMALAAEAIIERIEIDTTHFKGNYPDRVAVEGRAGATGEWQSLVEETRAGPDASHGFAVDAAAPASQVRLRILPDGGVARLRVRGRVTDDGWRAWGARWLDALTPSRAAEALASCCASSAWVQAMVDARPFGDFSALAEEADRVWAGLPADDWQEAFAAHPHIGEHAGGAWSRQEQSAAAAADTATREALADANREYERRFGRVFLINATGKSAEEVLAALRRRLDRDADAELRTAVDEQRQITRIRLEKLVRPETGG